MDTMKPKLPAPRLELRWEPKLAEPGHEWDTAICRYLLVLPLKEHDIRREGKDGESYEDYILEISHTEVTGSGERPVVNGIVTTPYRDGAHAEWDSDALGGVPIYAVCGDDVTLVREARSFHATSAKDERLERLVEALDNVTAALETCLAHFKMTPGDYVHLAHEARALIAEVRPDAVASGR
jgi:hypothetical protein